MIISCVFFFFFLFDMFIFILFNSFYLYFILCLLYLFMLSLISQFLNFSQFLTETSFHNFKFALQNKFCLISRLMRRLRRPSLTLTSLSESTNMMIRSISSSSAMSLFQYSCSISRACLQQADHFRSPKFSMPSSMSVSTLVFRKWRFLRPT